MNTAHLRANYEELTWQERRTLRIKYIEAQEGLCHYCQGPLDGRPAKHVRSKPVKAKLFPKTFFQYPVHLHHSHDTGFTIGAVHCQCNAVLWQYHHE